MPTYLMSQTAAGWIYPTDYGWRFFPGSAVRKTLLDIRAAGYLAKRMACGTYRCERVQP